MANRYWVGGTNTWNGTAGTKWSTTSGGAGGASVPTSADDVFFTNLSTGTCTIATGNTGAKSINCTGFTGTITGTASFSLSGSLTLVSGMTWTYSGNMSIFATGILISAGKTFGPVTIFGSATDTVTLGGAITINSSSSLIVTGGTFDTANYNVTCLNQFASTSANTRAINLGSSVVSANTFLIASVSNLTFNAGTSQINLTSSTSQFTGGGQTYYNVSFNSTAGGTRGINGANTFNNLVFTGGSTGITQYSISDNQTITNIMNLGASTSATSRVFVSSSIIGTVRTITANTTTALANNCDFRDISIVGTASPISPTLAGDCGGNSGITFPASKTVYWNLTGTQNWSATAWATTAGGTPAVDNFPLAQDTAVFTNSGLAGTITIVNYNIGTIDASSRTTAMTLNANAVSNIYGNYTLGSGVTLTGTSIQTFSGRITQTFTSAGKIVTFPIIIDSISGSFELGDATTISNSITVTSGTFDAKIYNLTCRSFLSNNTNVRTISMGSGLWTLSGTGNVWNTTTTTNLTFNKGVANILLSDTSTASRTFFGGGLSYNKLTIGGTTGISVTAIGNSNTFTELASIKTVAHTITLNTINQTIDTWSVKGTAGNVVTVDSNAAGTRRTFTLTNVTSGIDYLSVKDIGELNGNKFYVGANSTDGGNNSNVYFTIAPIIVLNSGMLMMF